MARRNPENPSQDFVSNGTATQSLLLTTLKQQLALKTGFNTSKQLLILTDDFTPQLFSQIPSDTVAVLSNRFDTVHYAKNAGINTYLSDFDLSAIPEEIDCIFFRLAKEKSLSHHVINLALQRLSIGAKLFIIGEKKEGVKGYGERIKNLLDMSVEVKKNGLSYLISVTKHNTALDKLLPTQNYEQIVSIDLAPISNTQNLILKSKQGIFAWNKIDPGSAFLNTELDNWLSGFNTAPASLLDLGCGYGFLSVMALRGSLSYVHATDSNIIATTLCRENLAINNNNNLKISVSCDDCGQGIKDKFDCIISNPPFHRGFQHDQELTLKFLKQCQRLLARGGKALLVVNEFINIEKKATDFFKQVNIVASNKSYKLIELANDR